MENRMIYLRSHLGMQTPNPASSSINLVHHEVVYEYYEVDNPKWFWWYIGWFLIIIGITLSFLGSIAGAIWFSNYTGYTSGWLGILTAEIAFIASFSIWTLHEYLPKRHRKLTESRIKS